MHKPRIAVIGLKGLPAYGGAAAVGENLINHLHDSYEFTVYSISSHTHLKSGLYSEICNQIVFNSLKNRKLNSIFYYMRSTFHALFNSYDLIHLHHRDAAFTLPLLRLKYKVILTTHGMVLTDKWKRFGFVFEFQDFLFFRFASLITTVSLKDFQIVRAILNSKYTTVIHIPNGVNELKDYRSEKNYITFAAGRIIPNKGLHIFLEASIKLNLKDKIQIIGDLSQMQEYEALVENIISNLPNVTRSGLIKDKKLLFEAIGSSKLFVYPSLIESMSMMMLEVASLGIPMICSKIKENIDVFSEDEVLYFEPNNVEDLADKLNWALCNLSLMDEKANRARTKLLQKYLWKDIAIQYSKAYGSLINK